MSKDFRGASGQEQSCELNLSMRPSRCLEDDPCCSVLHALQLLNAACWSSMQQSVAIVQS